MKIAPVNTSYQANGLVYKETLSGGSYAQSTIASSLSDPTSIAVDGSGNVYIALYGTPNNLEASQVLEETPSGSTYTQRFWSGQGEYDFAVPTTIAVDATGNLYLTTSNGIVEVTLATAVDFGTVNVGSPISPISLIFTFDTAGSIGKPAVLTQGVAGLDFVDAGTGTCDTLGTSFVYTAGASCTVDVTFNPLLPGPRYGAAVLKTAAGNVIATGFVHGIGTAPQVNFPPGTQSTLSLSGAGTTSAIAADSAGNLYIIEAAEPGARNGSTVVKETLTGSGYLQSPVASGFVCPVGVAVDGAGDVFIADECAFEVLEETPSSGGGYTQSVPFTNLSNVESVAVDGSGNVYTAGPVGVLKETLTATGYVQSTIASPSDIAAPTGIAVDGQGNLYVADASSNSVFKETLLPGNGYAKSTLDSGFNQPEGVAVDASGNVFIADDGNNRIVKETFAAGTYTQSTLASGLSSVAGISLDGSGNVFALNYTLTSSIISKFDFADPPSLSFPTTTSGSTSTAQTVTVQNVGNTELTFPIPSSGNDPSIATNFSLSSTGSAACPLVGANSLTAGTLAPGGVCDLSISFAPTTGGTITGALVLTDTSLNAVAPGYAGQSISLSGTAPPLEVFTLASGSTSATASLGGTANYALTLTPGAGSTLPNVVTFSITGLPTGATANFSPASLPAGSSATSVTLTIQTSNTQAASTGRKSFTGGNLATVALGILVLPLVGMRSSRRRLPRIYQVFAPLLLAALALGTMVTLSACSGGGNSSSGPTAQTYTLVVTATDATTGTRSSTNLTLTVQ